jgi:hypothetical protein
MDGDLGRDCRVKPTFQSLLRVILRIIRFTCTPNIRATFSIYAFRAGRRKGSSCYLSLTSGVLGAHRDWLAGSHTAIW